eukprot:6208789-Pleurochrysis_carterae.AAC.3
MERAERGRKRGKEGGRESDGESDLHHEADKAPEIAPLFDVLHLHAVDEEGAAHDAALCTRVPAPVIRADTVSVGPRRSRGAARSAI